MLLLKAVGLQKAYGDKELFDIPKIEIHDGDRIALVGRNGSGKSTLLHILAGEQQADSGKITRFGDCALIRQVGKGGRVQDGKLAGLLGVRDSPAPSGGEQTRAAVAVALEQNAPLLLADEPSNNLDLDGIQTLETLLIRRKGALVLVSHDRDLLDSICGIVWEIEQNELRVFPGRYSDWLAQKQRERDFSQFEYEQYQSEKKRLLAEAHKIKDQARKMGKPPKRMSSSEWLLYKDTASIQQGHVQSRAKAIDKRVERLEIKEKPPEQPKVLMKLGDFSPIVSRTALRMDQFNKSFGERVLFEDTSFALPTGSKTALLGVNGSGKSTLLQYIMAQYHQKIQNKDVDACISLANGLKIAYFDQRHEILEFDASVIENARSQSNLPESDVRKILARLHFARSDVNKRVRILSGGERAKLALAKLLASDANLLILDEPCNHIDMPTIEALEELLENWTATLLLVTHDRRLIRSVANRLLFIEDHAIQSYEGDWKSYCAFR